jgi:hypothetical protein
MNNANEQIVLIKAEGYAVVRGRVDPDGSIEFNSPTCFPEPPVAGCLDNGRRRAQLRDDSRGVPGRRPVEDDDALLVVRRGDGHRR